MASTPRAVRSPRVTTTRRLRVALTGGESGASTPGQFRGNCSRLTELGSDNRVKVDAWRNGAATGAAAGSRRTHVESADEVAEAVKSGQVVTVTALSPCLLRRTGDAQS